MHKGPVAGYEVIGVKMILEDGSYHDVDSSTWPSRSAARDCFRETFRKADPVLLEPIMKVEVEIPTEFQGPVTGAISSKRGVILGTESREGFAVISAEVPLAEMFGYSNDLRSMTQGKGTFSMEFLKYQKVPAQPPGRDRQEGPGRRQGDRQGLSPRSLFKLERTEAVELGLLDGLAFVLEASPRRSHRPVPIASSARRIGARLTWGRDRVIKCNTRLDGSGKLCPAIPEGFATMDQHVEQSMSSSSSASSSAPSGGANAGRLRLALAGAVILLLGFPLVAAGRMLWGEWQALREEQRAAAASVVVGYPNISPSVSIAAKPDSWFRVEGDTILIWAGWRENKVTTGFGLVLAISTAGPWEILSVVTSLRRSTTR